MEGEEINPYPKENKVEGYFRSDSYDWTVFRLHKEDNKWKFVMVEHKQHEGYCKEFLGISNKVKHG